jgi:diketogulonate reductase-like aldo/keto reductase
MSNNKNKIYTLANGVKIPAIGFGTFLIEDGEPVKQAVKEALVLGYRHIDTAAIYNNEKGVGEGITASGVKREDIFLTTKVWNSDQGYETTKTAFQTSLEKLGTDYVDLYLIHWPKALNAETWRAMEELYAAKKIRAIGVCNFTIRQLEELAQTAKITPMINQVELHPQWPQPELQKYCKEKGILIESWGPLMQGAIFQITKVKELADQIGLSVAHLAIIWQLQQGNIALVKSEKPERIKSNLEVPDINLSSEQMSILAQVAGERIGPDPENFDF